MIVVPCPYCGPRNASELQCVGEATSQPDPNAASPEQWRSYLYLRRNLADWTVETWYHRAGCRRYFTVERHTVTNEIRSSRPVAQPPTEAKPEHGEA